MEFGRIPGAKEEYPRTYHDGDDDQSYGFLDAFKLQTGNTRGTQTVGYGGAKIDGANNRIVVTNQADNTSIGMGNIPGTDDFGFFSLDADGNLVKTEVNGTELKFRSDGTAYYISGVLPDDTEGDAYSKEGVDVRDAFS